MNFSEITNINIPEGVVSKITTLEGVVLWEKGWDIPDLPTPLANEIYYITIDGETAVIIPNGHNNRLVSNTYKNGIGKMVFEKDIVDMEDFYIEYRKDFIAISLPNHITKLGYYTQFNDCVNLKYIFLPKKLDYIGYELFRGCTSLEYYQVPKSIIEIEGRAFQDCTSLKKIILPDNLTTLAVTYNPVNYDIIASSQSIFEGCTSLQNIIIPDKVLFICPCCFQDCTSLKTVVIGNSVRVIMEKCFYYCESLHTIICKSLIAPSLESNVFSNVGTKVPEGTPKVLKVPSGSTGYNTWLSKLKGFTIEYTE